jgi:hypothetical protein
MAVAAVVSPQYHFWETLLRWDSAWYVAVARSGYPHFVPQFEGHAGQSMIAFFPLFPMTVRAASRVTGLSYEAAGLLVAFMLGATVSVVLWLFVASLGEGAVWRRYRPGD